MSKLSKDELIQKINEKEDIGDDTKIELMEDITDSFDVESSENSEYKNKYEELKEKYKERFLNSSKKDEKEDVEGLEEKKEISIKEI